MLTEEALEDPGIGELMECLRTQPAWSDIPVLLFADAERWKFICAPSGFWKAYVTSFCSSARSV